MDVGGFSVTSNADLANGLSNYARETVAALQTIAHTTDFSVEEQQQQTANILVQNQGLQSQLNSVNSHLASLQ